MVVAVAAVVLAVSVAPPPTVKLANTPPLEGVVVAVVVAVGFILPNSPVPGAMVAVDVPKILELVVVFAATAPNGLGDALEVSTAVESTLCSRLVNAGKAALAASSEAVDVPGAAGKGSSFLTSSFGFSSFFGSGCFSLVRFSTGVVAEADAPNVTDAPPKENAGLPLVAAPKFTTGLVGSELFALSGFGIGWIVVLPNPKTAGLGSGS